MPTRHELRWSGQRCTATSAQPRAYRDRLSGRLGSASGRSMPGLHWDSKAHGSWTATPVLDDGHALWPHPGACGAGGTSCRCAFDEARPRGRLDVGRRAGLDVDAEDGARPHRGRCAVGRLAPFWARSGCRRRSRACIRRRRRAAGGGNIDCKELVAGSRSTCRSPCPARCSRPATATPPRATARSGTAIECPMNAATLTIDLRDDRSTADRRPDTPAGWSRRVRRRPRTPPISPPRPCSTWMERTVRPPRARALALASLVVDLRVTQIVNGVKGVHAVLADRVLDAGEPGRDQSNNSHHVVVLQSYGIRRSLPGCYPVLKPDGYGVVSTLYWPVGSTAEGDEVEARIAEGSRRPPLRGCAHWQPRPPRAGGSSSSSGSSEEEAGARRCRRSTPARSRRTSR